MRSTLKTFMLASAIALAVPSLAQARGLKHTLTQPVASPVKIEVVLSEDMQHRANNLPKKLSDRGGPPLSRHNGFSSNGFYGDRALQGLVESLEDKMTRRFTKKGITVTDDAPVTIRVTIEDAKNNRPTLEQISTQPSLSFQSLAQGGASIHADIISQNGSSLGAMDYSYYETNFFNKGGRFPGVWQDANRSFTYFANKAAKALAN